MTISLELLVTLCLFAITIAAFFIARLKDAKDEGSNLKRLDNVENELQNLNERHRCTDSMTSSHSIDIVEITGKIDNLKEWMVRIDKKLDTMLERGK